MPAECDDCGEVHEAQPLPVEGSAKDALVNLELHVASVIANCDSHEKLVNMTTDLLIALALGLGMTAKNDYDEAFSVLSKEVAGLVEEKSQQIVHAKKRDSARFN